MIELQPLRGKIKIKHGFAFKGEYFSECGKYVVLTPGNFHESGGFKRDEAKDKFYTSTFPEEYLLDRGDLIVAMTEQTDGLLGSCAFVPAGDLYLHNQRLGLITCDPNEVEPDFLYYLFQTTLVRKQIRLSSTGSKVKHTSPDRIYDVLARLPKVHEQRKLSAVLGSLDTQIALNNKINAELEAMAKLIYDYWFIQFDFPDENDDPYKSSGGKMVWCDLLKREVPDGWVTGVLSDFGRIVGGSTPSKEVAENFTSNGTPWITPNDLSENIGNNFISKGEMDVSKAGLKAASLKVLPEGSVLLSSRAPIGYMAIARNPVTTNQGFKSFVPTDRFPTEYIFYAIKRLMPAILQNANGSTFKEISGGTLGMVKTSLPNEEIVKAFCEKVAPMLEMQNTLEAQNQELASLRDWLLPMLMNGQVTVGDSVLSSDQNEARALHEPAAEVNADL